MSTRIVVVVWLILLISGCGTSTEFARSMQEPVDLAKKAKEVAVHAGQDAKRIALLDAGGLNRTEFAELVCKPARQSGITVSHLGAFADALETVQDVAEAPEDESYAGYVAQFRRNTTNLRRSKLAPDANGEAMNDPVKRCLALFYADADAKTQEAPHSLFPTAASVVAIDEVIKSVLAAAEQVQRERAIRQTLTKLLPELRTVYEAMLAEYKPSGEVYVRYADQTSLASAMSKTSLGATLTMRRFMVAKTLIAQRESLAQCKGFECLGNPNYRRNLDDTVANMELYRNLSAINTVNILKELDIGITSAEKGLANPKLSQVFDGLMEVAKAIANTNEKYESYKGD